MRSVAGGERERALGTVHGAALTLADDLDGSDLVMIPSAGGFGLSALSKFIHLFIIVGIERATELIIVEWLGILTP